MGRRSQCTLVSWSNAAADRSARKGIQRNHQRAESSACVPWQRERNSFTEAHMRRLKKNLAYPSPYLTPSSRPQCERRAAHILNVSFLGIRRSGPRPESRSQASTPACSSHKRKNSAPSIGGRDRAEGAIRFSFSADNTDRESNRRNHRRPVRDLRGSEDENPQPVHQRSARHPAEDYGGADIQTQERIGPSENGETMRNADTIRRHI